MDGLPPNMREVNLAEINARKAEGHTIHFSATLTGCPVALRDLAATGGAFAVGYGYAEYVDCALCSKWAKLRATFGRDFPELQPNELAR